MKVDWQTLRLAEPGRDGYGETARPVEEVIEAAVARRLSSRRPTLVWILDGEDDRKNDLLEKKLFSGESVGLALKRFTCLLGDVQTIPDERRAARLARRLPLLYFYDPGGKLFARLSGRRAASRAAVSGRIGKLWNLSFEMSLKTYTKRMSSILDRLDRVEGKKLLLAAKKERAAGDPAKLGKLEKEERKIRAEEEKVLREERELLSACRLRAEFRSPDRD